MLGAGARSPSIQRYLTGGQLDSNGFHGSRKMILEKMAFELRTSNVIKEQSYVQNKSNTWLSQNIRHLKRNTNLIFSKLTRAPRSKQIISKIGYPLASTVMTHAVICSMDLFKDYIQDYMSKDMQNCVTTLITGGVIANFQSRLAFRKINFLNSNSPNDEFIGPAIQAIGSSIFASLWMSKDIFFEAPHRLAPSLLAAVVGLFLCASFSTNYYHNLSLREKEITYLTQVGIAFSCAQVVIFNTAKLLYLYTNLPKIERVDIPIKWGLEPY